jgi:hypothetical protein
VHLHSVQQHLIKFDSRLQAQAAACIDYVQFQGGIVTTIPAEVDPFSVHVVDTAAMLSPYLRTNIAAATYRTQSQVRSDISLTTTGTSGAATYNNSTGVLNIPRNNSNHKRQRNGNRNEHKIFKQLRFRG